MFDLTFKKWLYWVCFWRMFGGCLTREMFVRKCISYWRRGLVTCGISNISTKGSSVFFFKWAVFAKKMFKLHPGVFFLQFISILGWFPKDNHKLGRFHSRLPKPSFTEVEKGRFGYQSTVQFVIKLDITKVFPIIFPLVFLVSFHRFNFELVTNQPLTRIKLAISL